MRDSAALLQEIDLEPFGLNAVYSIVSELSRSRAIMIAAQPAVAERSLRLMDDHQTFVSPTA
jgi:hypothetical protein